MFMNSVGLEFSLDTVGIAHLCSMMPGNSAEMTGISGGDSNVGPAITWRLLHPHDSHLDWTAIKG